VLDGEIVYLGKDGCPRFYDLMRGRVPQYFYAFDLLWKDGRDLRGLPLIQRKRLLKKIVKPPVLFVDHLAGRGVDLFRAACPHVIGSMLHFSQNSDPGPFAPEPSEPCWATCATYELIRLGPTAKFLSGAIRVHCHARSEWMDSGC
jgi:hypothetical protein